MKKIILSFFQTLYVLNVGFDPVFIDVITKIYDKNGKQVKELPSIGDHHPWSKIKLIPGGNGFNFARALHHKRLEVMFWSKIDDVYKALVNLLEPSMKLGFLSRERAKLYSNITVALETSKGEIQINSVRFGIAADDLNDDALRALKQTKVLSFLNIGLNRFWRALFAKMCEVVTKNENRLEISLFDPSTLKGFEGWKELRKWFEESFSSLPGIKIISVNEFEAKEITSRFSFNFLRRISNYFIVHTARSVSIYGLNGKEMINVPFLNNDPVTHVGVGDTFNAGLIYSLLEGEDIKKAVKEGIKYAQKLMVSGWEGLS